MGGSLLHVTVYPLDDEQGLVAGTTQAVCGGHRHLHLEFFAMYFLVWLELQPCVSILLILLFFAGITQISCHICFFLFCSFHDTALIYFFLSRLQLPTISRKRVPTECTRIMECWFEAGAVKPHKERACHQTGHHMGAELVLLLVLLYSFGRRSAGVCLLSFLLLGIGLAVFVCVFFMLRFLLLWMSCRWSEDEWLLSSCGHGSIASPKCCAKIRNSEKRTMVARTQTVRHCALSC